MIARKIIIVFLLSILCALSIHLIQFFQIYRIIPQDAQNVIAQSIPCVRYLPVIMSIRTYVILLYALRALIAFGLGLIVMLISNYSKSRVNTIALSVFLMGIPMVLLSYFFIATS